MSRRCVSQSEVVDAIFFVDGLTPRTQFCQRTLNTWVLSSSIGIKAAIAKEKSKMYVSPIKRLWWSSLLTHKTQNKHNLVIFKDVEYLLSSFIKFHTGVAEKESKMCQLITSNGGHFHWRISPKKKTHTQTW